MAVYWEWLEMQNYYKFIITEVLIEKIIISVKNSVKNTETEKNWGRELQAWKTAGQRPWGQEHNFAVLKEGEYQCDCSTVSKGAQRPI